MPNIQEIAYKSSEDSLKANIVKNQALRERTIEENRIKCQVLLDAIAGDEIGIQRIQTIKNDIVQNQVLRERIIEDVKIGYQSLQIIENDIVQNLVLRERIIEDVKIGYQSLQTLENDIIKDQILLEILIEDKIIKNAVVLNAINDFNIGKQNLQLIENCIFQDQELLNSIDVGKIENQRLQKQQQQQQQSHLDAAVSDRISDCELRCEKASETILDEEVWSLASADFSINDKSTPNALPESSSIPANDAKGMSAFKIPINTNSEKTRGVSKRSFNQGQNPNSKGPSF